MNNREHLGNMAMIDLLHQFKQNLDDCAGLFLTGERGISSDYDRCEKYQTCYDCIATWLNEEVRSNG